MQSIRRSLARSSLLAVFFAVLGFGALICTRYLDSSVAFTDPNATAKSTVTFKPPNNSSLKPPRAHQTPKPTIEFPLNCSLGNSSHACPANYYPSKHSFNEEKNILPSQASSCPDYFRYIYEDLWPWRETGITKEMVMSARRTANFRLVILKGKAYVETYQKSFQTRDVFTLWGILQLLRKYPGKIPDLDMMFDCVDWPVVKKKFFANNRKSPIPPPLFRYCGDDLTYDIVFPDWSFWGWSEINIKPWEQLSEDLKEGNRRSKWEDREAHAYWKGNPHVAQTRMDLLKCNVSDKEDWNARVYIQDWFKEQKQGYKESNLAGQCVHRYKIYIEGSAWSVSEKYILACDSVTLLVKPHYYDFFTRSLVPLKHYWPVKDEDKCRSIKHAVEWGNNHHQEAQAIGRAASNFILEDLKMDYVYDYMFHLLTEYAKLLKYVPTVPKKAVELCSEAMVCSARGFEKKFMTDSLVKGPKLSGPCTMPSPFTPSSLHSVIDRNNAAMKKVDSWEEDYWKSEKNLTNAVS